MSCVGFAREWEKLGANPSFSSPQAIPTQEQYSPQEKTIDDFSLLLMKNDQKKKKPSPNPSHLPMQEMQRYGFNPWVRKIP